MLLWWGYKVQLEICLYKTASSIEKLTKVTERQIFWGKCSVCSNAQTSDFPKGIGKCSLLE